MQQRHKGFSLMESLVSLLVFSIGMLGLGQLQARLWVNSGDIHSTDKAYLVAANRLERYEINSAASRPASAPGFAGELYSSSTNSTTTTEVQVSWERPSGSEVITIASTFNSTFIAADALWLLPIPGASLPANPP